ncbi:MAG TPA: hypothetical protein VNY52_02370 [Solirubrobacteraceae bacterium]|jgi:hypothetical protein|nr:hypothetical protein [Solirubrobacteraceae bacterium]
MSESDAIKGIRHAAKRREYAERLRHQATDELRERMREAQADGVPIARIAGGSSVSSGGLRPAGGGATFLTSWSKSSRVGIGMRWPAGVVCFGSSGSGVSATYLG